MSWWVKNKTKKFPPAQIFGIIVGENQAGVHTEERKERGARSATQPHTYLKILILPTLVLLLNLAHTSVRMGRAQPLNCDSAAFYYGLFSPE
jgi:hypothetical protein